MKKGDVIRAVQKSLELLVGTNIAPLVGAYNYFKDDKVNEEDLYQMLGITPYYLPARYAKEKKKREKESQEEGQSTAKAKAKATAKSTAKAKAKATEAEAKAKAKATAK